MEKKCSIISYLGEFKDEELESEYFKLELLSSKKYIVLSFYAIAVLFLLFLIPDFILNKESESLLIILTTRFLFMLFTLFINYIIKKIIDVKKLVKVITFYSIFFPLSFFSIIYFYETPDFLIQTMGLVLIIIGLFSVPNKMKNVICLSIFTILVFFVLVPSFSPPIKISHFSASLVYTILTVTLCYYNTYRGCYIKRTEYLNSKNKSNLLIKDHLTGIYNRLKFEEELHKWFEYSKRNETELSVILLDIDNFKTINDSYGHLTGDYILKTVVGVIMQNIREYDIFARWGGEEFVILLPNTNQHNAVSLSFRICELIEATKFKINETITCSIGVNTLHAEDSEESFLHYADINLYEAKRSGKNCVKHKASTSHP